VSVSGRVLRGGRDTVRSPTLGWCCTALARDAAGPLDSNAQRRAWPIAHAGAVRTDQRYAVSVSYDSIAYFSLPLNVTGRPAPRSKSHRVSHTSTGPPIRLTRRLVTVARATDDVRARCSRF